MQQGGKFLEIKRYVVAPMLNIAIRGHSYCKTCALIELLWVWSSLGLRYSMVFSKYCSPFNGAVWLAVDSMKPNARYRAFAFSMLGNVSSITFL